MTRRKDRIPVVLDTNVLVGYYLSRSPDSPNAAVFRLWRDQRRLQLVVSAEVVREYTEVLERLGVSPEQVQRLAARLDRRDTVTHVRASLPSDVCRDPDDTPFLAAAATGKARFLVTNDRDLLELPEATRRRFRFVILTPGEFLTRLSD